MGRIERQLSTALADEIAKTLQPDPALSAAEDAELQRATAEALVREALRDGQFADITGLEMESFSAGNTAMLVARVDTRLTFVVKVDRSPSLVAEAHLLRRAATDPALPESLRRTFPRVFAIDDEGPIYGYLMEDLGGFTTVRDVLATADPDFLSALLANLWTDVLAPAYGATLSTRIVANVSADYFERAQSRLEHAATLGLLPPADAPITIQTPGDTCVAPSGWGDAVARGLLMLADVSPSFSTFVHGDLHPENVLWLTAPTGEFQFRVIDPKDWWVGDYLFDVAKFGHYLRVTAPVEQYGIAATIGAQGEGFLIDYDDEKLASYLGAERDLIDQVAPFARKVDSAHWRRRYELALAAILLGIVGPRLEAAERSAEDQDRSLALIALGEAIRLINK